MNIENMSMEEIRTALERSDVYIKLLEKNVDKLRELLELQDSTIAMQNVIIAGLEKQIAFYENHEG